MGGLVEGGVGAGRHDHLRLGDAPLLAAPLAGGLHRAEDALGAAGGHEAGDVVVAVEQVGGDARRRRSGCGQARERLGVEGVVVEEHLGDRLHHRVRLGSGVVDHAEGLAVLPAHVAGAQLARVSTISAWLIPVCGNGTGDTLGGGAWAEAHTRQRRRPAGRALAARPALETLSRTGAATAGPSAELSRADGPAPPLGLSGPSHSAPHVPSRPPPNPALAAREMGPVSARRGSGAIPPPPPPRPLEPALRPSADTAHGPHTAATRDGADRRLDPAHPDRPECVRVVHPSWPGVVGRQPRATRVGGTRGPATRRAAGWSVSHACRVSRASLRAERSVARGGRGRSSRTSRADVLLARKGRVPVRPYTRRDEPGPHVAGQWPAVPPATRHRQGTQGAASGRARVRSTLRRRTGT